MVCEGTPKAGRRWSACFGVDERRKRVSVVDKGGDVDVTVKLTMSRLAQTRVVL